MNHPDWALQYKRPGTELKLINGRYYLYGVKSVYDKTAKRSRKVPLGILGSISREKGFIPSEKAELKKKSVNTYHEFMRPTENRRRTVLIDTTDIVLESDNIGLSGKGYNSSMDFQPQFVLLYMYDALSLEPLREVVDAEMNKSTKTLIKQMKISIT